MIMNCYQIVELTENFNHAGTKATADIAAIAERMGFIRVPVSMDTTVDSSIGKMIRQKGYFRDWNAAYNKITQDSIVLLQHPFHHKQLTREKILWKLKNKKHVKYISLIHDVEELRAFRFNDYYAHEFQTMLALADVFIVHNQSMKQWFLEQGVDEKKLIILEIFDYLYEDVADKEYQYSKSITVAGNLDTEKCGYIGRLGQLKGVPVDLYGPNFDESLNQYANITYHGSFPSDEVPYQLKKGFGLVWDGESVEGCLGLSGQYLRYNNPHKLSLYIASGIPVVIWKEAAEARFVRENHLGLCVDNLHEMEDRLDQLTEEEYRDIRDSVMSVKSKLLSGHFANKALEEALHLLTGDHLK